MKVVEHCVLAHRKSITDAVFGLLLFTYRANSSTENAENLALHHVLEHMDSAGNYTRILFMDLCSAFNTILPSVLEHHLSLRSITNEDSTPSF